MEPLPIRRTSITSINAQVPINEPPTNNIAHLPPTTSCTNSAFFPTVFEEEPESFSQTSSDNDELNDDFGKFEEDVELWSPTKDMGIMVVTTHGQSSIPISYMNKKPRRRLPVITQVVTNTSNSSQCKVENGSCSIDSGISRLLSSVDKAVSSVANKAIKKSEHNKTSFQDQNTRCI